MKFGAWVPSDYSPNLDSGAWATILSDRLVVRNSDCILLACLKDIGYCATCLELSHAYGRNWNFYNTHSWQLAKRIVEAGYCEAPIRENGCLYYWPVLYQGRDLFDSDRGSFEWSVRSELCEVLSQIDFSDVDLYG